MSHDDSRKTLEDTLARKRPERDDMAKEFDRVIARFTAAKDKYPDSVPASVQLDILVEYMFVSARCSRILVAEHPMSPSDCITVHAHMPSNKEIDDVLSQLDGIRDEVRDLKASIPKAEAAPRSKLAENAVFWLTALAVICLTAWGIHTINAIPPEYRRDAFSSVVDVLKIHVDRSKD